MKSIAFEMILFTILLCGCSGKKLPSLVDISGTVSDGGKILDEVHIEFMPDPEKENVAQMSSGETGPDGKFTLTFSGDASKKGVSKGWVRVVLIDAKSINSRDNPVDPRFSSDFSIGSTTPIRLEITDETKTVDIDIAKFRK